MSNYKRPQNLGAKSGPQKDIHIKGWTDKRALKYWCTVFSIQIS